MIRKNDRDSDRIFWARESDERGHKFQESKTMDGSDAWGNFNDQAGPGKQSTRGKHGATGSSRLPGLAY